MYRHWNGRCVKLSCRCASMLFTVMRSKFTVHWDSVNVIKQLFTLLKDLIYSEYVCSRETVHHCSSASVMRFQNSTPNTCVAEKQCTIVVQPVWCGFKIQRQILCSRETVHHWKFSQCDAGSKFNAKYFISLDSFIFFHNFSHTVFSPFIFIWTHYYNPLSVIVAFPLRQNSLDGRRLCVWSMNILTYLLTPWSRVLLEKLTSKICS